MKCLLTLLTLLLLAQNTLVAQETKAIHECIRLEMPAGAGRNAASVAYHPVQKKYYSGFAGNPNYRMAVFDSAGKCISPAGLKVGFDLRGLWYNKKLDSLQANGYIDFGFTNLVLNSRGMPAGHRRFLKAMVQPTDQSAGCFDDLNQTVYFLSDNKVMGYDLNGTRKTEVKLWVAADEEKEEPGDELPEQYNSTNLVFTGLPNAAFGLLDCENKQVVLFDSLTGKPAEKWEIDADAELPAVFGFSYTNNIVFIYNREERVWIGYK
jgi:hypothetical protein